MKRLFQIFAFAALAFGFTACETPGETTNNGETTLTLKGDKSEIVADGVDKVTFTVLVNGEANSEAQIVCTKDNSIVENNTFTTTEAGDYLFKAIYGNKSSEAFKVTASKPTLELTADKIFIDANGTDMATFSVTFQGEDVTSECTITNLNTSTALEGNTFATDVAGDYVFEAQYGTYTSAQLTIYASTEQPVQKTLKLSASKMRIQADGQDSVVFTAMYGDEDVTASCTIKTTAGLEIENGVFTTTTVGTYNFYALYEEQRSNTVSIDAYDPALASQYEIGTICEVNGTKGVIYAIKTDKNNYTWVYVVSLDEERLQWSTENVWCNCGSDKGAWNTYDPFDERYSHADGGVRDINNYPAFKWCMEHGADWFLPSSTELQWLWDATSGGTHTYDCDTMKAFNKVITDNGGTPIGEDYYWSSNETSYDMIELIAFMDNSVVCLEPYKTKYYQTRAVARFNI